MAETWRKWKGSERPKSLSERSFLKQLQRPSSRRRSQHAANPCRRTALSATPATPATPAQPATALPSHKYSSRGRRRRRWWVGGGGSGSHHLLSLGGSNSGGGGGGRYSQRLNTQWRMPRPVAAFVAAAFYRSGVPIYRGRHGGAVPMVQPELRRTYGESEGTNSQKVRI